MDISQFLSLLLHELSNLEFVEKVAIPKSLSSKVEFFSRRRDFYRSILMNSLEQ